MSCSGFYRVCVVGRFPLGLDGCLGSRGRLRLALGMDVGDAGVWALTDFRDFNLSWGYTYC